MRSATFLLLAVLGAVSSARATDHLEARAASCNRAKAVSLIKKNNYTKFCSNLIRATTTKTVQTTSTIYTNDAGSTVTLTNFGQATVTATLLQVDQTNVATNTVSVTGTTTTVSNPTFPVQSGARQADYRVRPTKPAKLVHCAYGVLNRACDAVVTTTPPRVTATVTVGTTITTGTAAAPTTVIQQGGTVTVTVFSTSRSVVTGTATSSVSATAIATQPAFLNFRDPSNTNLVRQLQFTQNAGAGTPNFDALVVSSTVPATPFVFQADTVVADFPSPAHNGLVSGILTTTINAATYCLSTGAANLLTAIACTPATAYTTAANRFSLDPKFLYVYSGVFPGELHVATRDATAGTVAYQANASPAPAGSFTIFLSNSNSTGF